VEMNDAAYPSALPKPVGKLRGTQAMSATKPQEGMSMHRIRQNARQRLVMLAICAPIYLTPVDAQIDTPTANQRAAIQDLFKVSAAMDLCGYDMNARKVSSDLAQIDMTLRDVTAKGRFWSYVSAIWPSWWDELHSRPRRSCARAGQRTTARALPHLIAGHGCRKPTDPCSGKATL
jgi:hypothetical protein